MDLLILEHISVGLSINISRSDGRVHPAFVKEVHHGKRAVSVEWEERSIIKGKEVEFEELWNLNQDIFDYIKANTSEEPQPEVHRMETRLRSSRIPGPSTSSVDAGPSDVSNLDRKSSARRTCYMLEPAQSEEEFAAVPNGSAVPGLPHKNGVPSTRFTCMPKITELNGELPPPGLSSASVTKARRKSAIGPAEAEKHRVKRAASQAKAADVQPKRGKNCDANRPNWQFYQMIEEYRATLDFVPLSASDPVQDLKICVCVRKRPLNKQELGKKEIDVVSIPGKGALMLHEPKQKVDLTKYLENQVFRFDYSFDETASNEMVYRFTAKPLVRTIFEGSMATCFAYGQTGSGKTHTMGGDFSGKKQNSSTGIYALTAHDVFFLLNQRKYASAGLEPYLSFFEIYNGKVYDLLNKKALLRVLEDGKQQVQVVGLQEVNISSAEEVIKLIGIGSACRTSGQTSANVNSSRSHAILQIILRHGKRLHGKFSLVDLAGNERGTDVSSKEKQTMTETAEINCSLLALKECIRSLALNSDHVPFRMSKLTQVLRDSFIGENSRTCMIAMIAPGMSSCDYTLNTLRYADRVKELNGAPRVNESDKKMESEMDIDDADLSEDSDASMGALREAELQVLRMKEQMMSILNQGADFVKLMKKPSYNMHSGLPEILNYSQRLTESIHSLQAAVTEEDDARMLTHRRKC